ncbi:MAG: nucleotidyl transferase AbiEii/AbiGii toxin family protein [Minisyncoccia bacterium]|jgi:predicted nucleotidyltransferase component of viral defense system
MFEQVLPADAKKSLAILGKSGLLNGAYLAGGTALALQIGHRISVDFDFFTPEEFDENILVQRMQKTIPDFKLDRMEWGTILGYIGETRFSLFFYNYPLLFKTHDFMGVKIADIKDIAPMKIAAISDRGTKRDFIDLFFLIEEEKTLTLEEALELYDKKFGLLKQNRIHILKSLVYFDDAEKGGEPKMIKDISWDKIKKRIAELALAQ